LTPTTRTTFGTFVVIGAALTFSALTISAFKAAKTVEPSLIFSSLTRRFTFSISFSVVLTPTSAEISGEVLPFSESGNRSEKDSVE